jgi:hypothetical protein
VPGPSTGANGQQAASRQVEINTRGQSVNDTRRGMTGRLSTAADGRTADSR